MLLQMSIMVLLMAWPGAIGDAYKEGGGEMDPGCA